VTAAVCVIAVPLAVAETVLIPATVELSVPVATPLAFVVPLGWVSVLPVPVAASTTVAPLIGLPLPSFTVTVTVALPLPAVSDGGAAATVDCEPETGPTVTTTVAVCVMAVPVIVAETVFVSGTIELSVPVATPLALVVPLGWVSVLPLPVAASATVAPLIGLPLASFAVTEIVDVPVPTGIELGEATTVDCEAETGPALTVTDAVCVIAVPFAVAETVFVPAPVELSVPVATPLAFVVPLGWVRVLLLPVAASTTVAPLIGLPPASFTVTVIVALPLPAVIEVGEAATVESEAETAPAVTVTAAVWVIAVPLAVAETVLVSSTVELRVPVATPLALVVPLGCVRVLPLPVAASTTVAPLIGFPFASFAVTVIVDVPPTAMDVGEAATVDCEAETEPDVTVTVAVCVTALPLIVAETVFVPATVELSVPVATPLALVVPLGCDNVLPLPVAASTTVAPLIGFPFASFAVTVIVAVPPTPMDVGEAATVDCEAETAPGFTVTDAVWVMAVPLAVAETVFTSATVELSVPAATPLELVGPLGWVRVLPLPVTERTTVAPLIGFPFASFTVTVMVEFPLPAVSVVGEALTVDSEAETGGPEPGAAWQAVDPVSLNVWPATGTNFQA